MAPTRTAEDDKGVDVGAVVDASGGGNLSRGEADAYVRAHKSLEWTILRPGSLTNDAGKGLVRLEAHTGRGMVPRDDVAAVLAELVDTPATAGLTLELISGSAPVSVAVQSVAGN